MQEGDDADGDGWGAGGEENRSQAAISLLPKTSLVISSPLASALASIPLKGNRAMDVS